MSALDSDVHRAVQMAQAVRRDQHKMKAFVRFRQIAGGEPEQFVAWFEPEQHVVGAVAPLFQARFAGMRWSILTPQRSVHWDGATLSFAPGAKRQSAPADDALDDLWRTYYAHIFNPARLKVKAKRAEMPVKYWRILPEARAIKPLVCGAGQRTGNMINAGPSSAPEKAGKWTPRPPRRPRGSSRFAESWPRCLPALLDLWTARNLLERNELVSTRAFGPDMQVSEW